ncbi:MAG: biotin/lipoyl-containing protein [Caldilineaceae bacterium]
MATPVIMPKFGMAQEEGTILRWHKAEGDHVHKGDVILEVMTDKVDMEVEALLTASRGRTTLRSRHHPARDHGARLPAGAGRALPAGTDTPVADTVRTAAETAASPAAKSDVKASPVAQRVAAGAGVDLRTVQEQQARQPHPAHADVEAALATRPGGDGHADGAGDACGGRIAREERCGSGRGDGDRSQEAGAGGRCERFAAAVASAHTGTSEDVTTGATTTRGCAAAGHAQDDCRV